MGIEPKQECYKCQTYTKNKDHTYYFCCLPGYCPGWVDPQSVCEHDFQEYYYSGSNMLGMQCTKCGLQDPSTWRKKVWE